ncbi:13218_t:CDS:1, partial [Ambispora gerdemannii]
MRNVNIPEYISSPIPVLQNQASEDAQLSVLQDAQLLASQDQ